MASMRSAAAESYRSKMGRMGLAEGGNGKGQKISTASLGEDVGIGHTGPEADGSLGMNSGGRAEGYETEAANEATLKAKAGKPRLDRPHRATGGRVKKGGTTVNVIVASGGPKEPPAAPPMPPPMPMPPPEMMGAGGPPPGAGGPPLPGVPMGRKAGGRVPHLTGGAGAGGGKGRLAKIKSYGDNARA